MQALKAHSLKGASKNFHTSHGRQKNAVLPQTHLIRYAPITQDTCSRVKTISTTYETDLKAQNKKEKNNR